MSTKQYRSLRRFVIFAKTPKAAQNFQRLAKAYYYLFWKERLISSTCYGNLFYSQPNPVTGITSKQALKAQFFLFTSQILFQPRWMLLQRGSGFGNLFIQRRLYPRNERHVFTSLVSKNNERT